MADSYQWEQGVGRFRHVASGKFVPESQVRADVEQVITAGQARVAALTERLTAGSLTPAAWEAQAGQVLSAVHLTSGALAHGGWASLDGETQGWIGARISGELDYLHGFTQEIAAGGLSDAQIAARAAMYPEAGHATYVERRRADSADRGQTEERNVLGSSNACDGCAAASAQGWVSLGTLSPVGTRQCRSRCRCQIMTRRARVASPVRP